MGLDLFNTAPDTTYDSLIKVGDNDTITGIQKRLSDGRGNDLNVWVSTSQFGIGGAADADAQFQVAGLTRLNNVDITGSVTNGLTIVGATIVDTLQFTGGTGTQGLVSWNADEETLDLVNNGAVLQLGQETHIHVRNNSLTTAIPNGTPVYVTGTLGASGRLKVAPMIADGSIDAKYFIGVTTEVIEADGDGKVTWFGKVRDFDTLTYGEGIPLYVSETVAGGWQTTPPTAPNPVLEVAFTVNAKSNGTIMVRGDVGGYLNTLHDVHTHTPLNGQPLVYDSTDGHWHNASTIIADVTGNLTGNVTGDLTGNVTGQVSDISNHTTTDLAEGTNLYYLNSRVDAHLSGGTGVTYSSGVISIGQSVGQGDNVKFNNLELTGNITFNGTATQIDSTIWTAGDNLVQFANENIANTLDLGYYANYSLDAGVTTKYTGLFRDSTDNVYKFFEGLEVEPSTTVDTSGTGYALADVQANTFIGALQGNADTATDADTLDGKHASQLVHVAGDTMSGFLNFQATGGIVQYTENGGRVNWDARDISIAGGFGAQVHKWNRNSTDNAYLPYYENWYDGNSYHSIGVENNLFQFDSGLNVVGAGTFTGNVTGANLNVSNWNTAYGWGDWSVGVDKAFVDALGVDADTLDGLSGIDFLRANAPDTATGNLTFSGVNTFNGSATFNDDITLNHSATGQTVDGITITNTDTADTGVLSVEAGDKLTWNGNALITEAVAGQYVKDTGDTMTGALTIENTAPVYYLKDNNSTGANAAYGQIEWQDQTGAVLANVGYFGLDARFHIDAKGNDVYIPNSLQVVSNVTATTFIGALQGNADTATSAGKWTTARTLTIGDTGKSVDGSGPVSWSRTEIGITKTNIDALGINATTLDGIDSSQFLRSDTSDTMNGSLTVNGLGEFAGALRITETGTIQNLLIGNQDSGGLNKPAMIQGVNGSLRFGYGNSWSGEGGTFTESFQSKSNGDVYFNNNVGIGTTSPLSATNNNGLHIDKGGHTTLMLGDGVNDGGVIQSSDNNRRMFIGANIYDDEVGSWSNFSTTHASAMMEVLGYDTFGMVRIGLNPPSGSGFPDIFFQAYYDASTSYTRLYSAGGQGLEVNNSANVIVNNNLGIGTTSPSYKLDVSGDIRATGNILAKSDVRVKENIETISDPFNIINELRGVFYNKIGEEEQSTGVIAQETEKVLPQVVSDDADGMKSVAYGNMVGVLIEGEKYLYNKINEMQQEINQLKSQLNGSS